MQIIKPFFITAIFNLNFEVMNTGVDEKFLTLQLLTVC